MHIVDRRRFLGSAAITIAAVELGMIGRRANCRQGDGSARRTGSPPLAQGIGSKKFFDEGAESRKTRRTNTEGVRQLQPRVELWQPWGKCDSLIEDGTLKGFRRS